MFPTKQPSLDIIIGPMFSGKTTELIRRLTIFIEAGLQVLYINTDLDTRTDNSFSTHNETVGGIGKICSTKVKHLLDVDISGFDVIGVDEAQMFDDLEEFVESTVDIWYKKLIVAGLNGDFLRRPFGKIHNLLPVCDNITKLYPFCKTCMDEKYELVPAIFTKRTTNERNVIVIGNQNIYIPVCRECYKK